MVGHGELARTRPAVRHLTEFYLWVSFGGVLGGIFAALLAPAVFPGIWEYPLMLAAACLVRPTAKALARGLALGPGAAAAAGARVWRRCCAGAICRAGCCWLR